MEGLQLSNSNARSTKTRIETLLLRRSRTPSRHSNARSTKTRIETIVLAVSVQGGIIRMQDPLKQGLKLRTLVPTKYTPNYSNARSTKTRIETSRICFFQKGKRGIRMQDPLKQGLKLRKHAKRKTARVRIRMQDPLKQGLKLAIVSYRARQNGFECKIH